MESSNHHIYPDARRQYKNMALREHQGSSWCSVLHFEGYLIERSRLRFVGSRRVLNAELWSILPPAVVDK